MSEKNHDPIHPNYYGIAPGIDCIDIAKHYDFCTGNVLKYITRAGKKSGNSKLQDLKKAQYYLNMLISMEEESSNLNVEGYLER